MGKERGDEMFRGFVEKRSPIPGGGKLGVGSSRLSEKKNDHVVPVTCFNVLGQRDVCIVADP